MENSLDKTLDEIVQQQQNSNAEFFCFNSVSQDGEESPSKEKLKHFSGEKGSMPVHEFLIRFEMLKEEKKWDEATDATKLTNMCTGKPFDLLRRLPMAKDMLPADKIKKLKNQLLKAFGMSEQVTWHSLTHRRLRVGKESVDSLLTDLKRYVGVAFDELDEKTQDTIALKYFWAALPDTENVRNLKVNFQNSADKTTITAGDVCRETFGDNGSFEEDFSFAGWQNNGGSKSKNQKNNNNNNNNRPNDTFSQNNWKKPQKWSGWKNNNNNSNSWGWNKNDQKNPNSGRWVWSKTSVSLVLTRVHSINALLDSGCTTSIISLSGLRRLKESAVEVLVEDVDDESKYINTLNGETKTNLFV